MVGGVDTKSLYAVGVYPWNIAHGREGQEDIGG